MYLGGFMIMICILCMIWVWLGIYEKWYMMNVICWLNALALLKNDVYGKCVLYCLKFIRLKLGIGNLMSSHSLSAGHVPLGLGRDKVGLTDQKLQVDVSNLQKLISTGGGVCTLCHQISVY